MQVVCSCRPRLDLPPVLPALHFYQRRGYRLTHLVPDSVVAHTKREVAGFAGIPVRDEVRLEKRLP